MSFKKKLIIIISISICVLVITFGIFYGVRQYRKGLIDFKINDNLINGNGKKAKVIILAGQSNAAGCSGEEYLEKNVSNDKYLEYKNGYDNIYINYYVTGKNSSDGFVETSTNQGEPGGNFGPEVGIAEKLNELYPNETFFIIKFAWSASEMYTQWTSPSSEGKTGIIYRNFVRYIDKNLKYLASKDYDVSIEGICWMQGESDSFFVETATDYEAHLSNFIKDLRKKYDDYASNDGIALIDAYIAASPAYWVYYDLVNASKKAVADSSPINVVIDTNAHGLACDKEPEENPDIPHYDSLSQLKLGNLFAEQLIQFFN